MLLSQIEKKLEEKKRNLAAAPPSVEAEKPRPKRSKPEGYVTVGMEISTETRDRLVALKARYGVKSISAVATMVLAESLSDIEAREREGKRP